MKGKSKNHKAHGKNIFSGVAGWITKKFEGSCLKESFAATASRKTWIILSLDILLFLLMFISFSFYMTTIAANYQSIASIQELASSAVGGSDDMDPESFAALTSSMHSIQTALISAVIVLFLSCFLIMPFVWKLTVDDYLKKDQKAGWKFWRQWKYMLKFLALAWSITIINLAAFLLIRGLLNQEFILPILMLVVLPLHMFFLINGTVLLALGKGYLESLKGAYKLIKKIGHYIVPAITMFVMFLVILIVLLPLFSKIPYLGIVLKGAVSLVYFVWMRYYFAAVVHRLNEQQKRKV